MSIKLSHSRDFVDHHSNIKQSKAGFEVWLEVEASGKTVRSRPEIVKVHYEGSDYTPRPEHRQRIRQIVEQLGQHVTSDDPKTAQAQLKQAVADHNESSE